MIDICANLQNSQFAQDRSAVLERAAEAGVEGILACSTDLDMALDNQTLCKQAQTENSWPTLATTAGVHPHDAQKWQDADSERLRMLSANPFVSAIGECGLDFNRNFSEPAAQRRAFQAQIEVACETHKPLLVHDRDSNGEVLHWLTQPTHCPSAVVHCFTGNATELEKYLDAGCYIGITGWLCDRTRGDELRKLVSLIPDGRLMIETDAPFLRPQNAPDNERMFVGRFSAQKKYRRRNEPALLGFVLSQLAELRQQNPEDLAQLCATNAKRLFGFDAMA